MFAENIVGNIADPELEPNGAVSFCKRPRKDISRAMLIVGLHNEFSNELS